MLRPGHRPALLRAPPSRSTAASAARRSSPTSTGTTCRACRSSRPVLVAGAEFDIYAPPQDDGRSVDEAFDVFMQPPYFPVRVTDLPSEHPLPRLPGGPVHDRRRRGAGPARSRTSASPTATASTWGGATVAYLPDHQQPLDGSIVVAGRRARAGGRRRPADPRRAVHDGRVRREGALGPLHRTSTRSSWPSEAGAKPPRPVPPRSGPHRRRARRAWLRCLRVGHGRLGHRGAGAPPRAPPSASMRRPGRRA